MKRRILPLILILLATCAQAAPKNVILLIGDGMGTAQITLARLELSRALNIDSMPYAGLVTTHSADSKITDSAAAATALATGHKTANGMISTLPDGTKPETILEAAMRKGKAVGLVTTVTATHATPAAFGAHVGARSDETEIGRQYLAAGIGVIMGCGQPYFDLAEAKRLGYTVVDSEEELGKAEGKLLAHFEKRPSLAVMTRAALSDLSQDPDGFFLMVEGGQIDWRCHDNDAAGTVRETEDFDEAVGAALSFAKRGDTLVVVTADHETGGLTITYEGPKWAAKGHTACMVGIFAAGCDAEAFTGTMDNTDVAKRIDRVAGYGLKP
ncbi:MAG: alkaline phosphatase [Armatimonadota bacterium]